VSEGECANLAGTRVLSRDQREIRLDKDTGLAGARRLRARAWGRQNVISRLLLLGIELEVRDRMLGYRLPAPATTGTYCIMRKEGESSNWNDDYTLDTELV